jgi:oxygen-independent coproporphyrinogen-3 oxidase
LTAPWYTAAQMQAHSLYLHIPFCHHRCSYCDFNTYAGIEALIPDYVEALCHEIYFLTRSYSHKIPIHTIFLGGGTPSLLPSSELNRIFTTIHHEFNLQEGLEITLEANPDRLSFNYLKSIHEIGINRISLGMQSANPEELQLLERQHGFNQVAEAVSLIRKAGFRNLNLDLIFGIPNQNLRSWQRTIELAASLNPEHLSLYSLTIENGTPMGNWLRKGLLSEPDQDIAAQMYEWAQEKLSVLGYQQYEISNWARQDQAGKLLACQHNLQYWRNLPYLGVGAGAHGFTSGFRTENECNPRSYIQKLSAPLNVDDMSFSFPRTPAVVNWISINREDEMKETMLMGLRLTQDGVSRNAFRSRFGTGMEDFFRAEIEQSIQLGLLEWVPQNSGKLRLTPRGRLLGNQVFMQFV